MPTNDDESAVKALLKRLNDHETVVTNLSETQERCTKLLEENRALANKVAQLEGQLFLAKQGVASWTRQYTSGSQSYSGEFGGVE